MISVAVNVVVVKGCIFILVPSILLFKQEDYILISVNCDKEFWSPSSDSVTA